MRVQLWKARGIPGYFVAPIDEETGTYDADKALLIQMDWDYPGVACDFGWDMRETQVMNTGYYGLKPCEHQQTDGTVNCSVCGLTPPTFIRDAAEYLDNHLGCIIADPGYFS